MRSLAMRGLALGVLLTTTLAIGQLPVQAAQLPGDQLWVSRQNGTADGSDEALANAISPDGSLVFVTGYSDALDGIGTDDVYMTVAYEAATGAKRWVRRYDGAPGCTDSGEAIAADPNGARVYVTGFSGCLGREDYATIAYDSSTGKQLWMKRYDGPTGDPDEASTLTTSPDGTMVYVSGRSFGRIGQGRDYATIAYDASSGNERWVRRYNGPGLTEEEGHDEAHAIGVSPDGNSVFVTGASFGRRSDWDYATIAYDATTGKRTWLARYDGPTSFADYARGVGVSPDGETVFVTGYSYGGSFSDYTTLAYDAATGEQRWLRRYDGPADGYDFGQDIAIGPGDELYVTGYSDGVDSWSDYATISYEGATGQRRWVDRYDGPAHDSDTARAIGITPDGSGVFVTGWSFGLDSVDFPFDILTVGYDASNGHRQWVRRYNGPSNGSDGGNDLVVAPGGSSVYVAGFSDRAGAGSNFDYLTAAYADR
jgi:PQQ-like domain